MARVYTDNEKRALAITVIFGFVIGYFALGVVGVLPDSINLVESVWGDAPDGDDNTTGQTELETSLVQVTGIPEAVNVSAGGTNSYTIQFMAMEGESGEMAFRLINRNMMTNASIEITDAEYGWVIAEDGMSARYGGADLIPYESTTITLTIEGDEFTRPGSVMVLCASDGRTTANQGLVTIVT